MAMMMGRGAWFDQSDEGIDLRNDVAPSPFSGFTGFGDDPNRDGNRALVTGSGFWDEAFYKKYNPDVVPPAWNLPVVDHFIMHGGLRPERRDPGRNFSTGTYYDKNPDVWNAGAHALLHYLRNGRNEGRIAYPSSVYLAEQKAAADALAAQQQAAVALQAQQRADADALAASKAATDKATADAALQRQLATQAQADAAAAARAQADAQAAAQAAQIAAAQNANDLQAALAAQAANEAKAAADRLASQAALDAARADAAAFAAESHAQVTVVTGRAPAAVTAPAAEPAVSKVLLYGGLAVLALLLLKK